MSAHFERDITIIKHASVLTQQIEGWVQQLINIKFLSNDTNDPIQIKNIQKNQKDLVLQMNQNILQIYSKHPEKGMGYILNKSMKSAALQIITNVIKAAKCLKKQMLFDILVIKLEQIATSFAIINLLISLTNDCSVQTILNACIQFQCKQYSKIKQMDINNILFDFSEFALKDNIEITNQWIIFLLNGQEKSEINQNLYNIIKLTNEYLHHFYCFNKHIKTNEQALWIRKIIKSLILFSKIEIDINDVIEFSNVDSFKKIDDWFKEYKHISDFGIKFLEIKQLNMTSD